MDLTLSAAAKVTGKSKSTLSRAIKSGRLSAHQDDVGVYHIDGAELSRVFPWNADEAAQRRTTQPHEAPQERPLVPTAETEVAVLRVRVEMLEALLDRERVATAELRQLITLLPGGVKGDPMAPALASAPASGPAPASGLGGFLARLLRR